MEIDGVSKSYINGLACCILGIQHDFRVYHRNHASYHEDEYQVVDTNCEEAQNHTGNHFLSLYLVKQDTGECSKDDCQNRTD